MLKEIRKVRQIPGEPRRRWFTSHDMDLVVWLDGADQPVELQLCYDKGRAERAFTWKPGAGFTHTAVDDGETGDGRYKATPILVADGSFDAARVGGLFLDDSTYLPGDIVRFVTDKIDDYGTSFTHRHHAQPAAPAHKRRNNAAG
jgi:hypothetical protein